MDYGSPRRCCSRGISPAWAGMIVFAAVVGFCSAACSYGSTAPVAIIGQRLVLQCTILCQTLNYEWVNITGDERVILTGMTDSDLVVSENVTTVADVGGQMYECHCSENCEMFRIGVKPIPRLFASVPVARSGSSVNVTCTAESYPPANSENNYNMKHPKDHDIEKVLLPERNGVVHIITNASKERDSGVYECTVTVRLEGYTEPLQSDNVVTNLLVYDPPRILNISNFTISEVGQSAILECNVYNKDDLDVWVNWTSNSGDGSTKNNVTLRKGNIFYLLVHNTTVGDYMCQLYSVYSPYIPEDVKFASVFMKEFPPPPKGSVTEQDDCGRPVILSVTMSVVALALVVVAVAVAGCVYYCRKYAKLKAASPPVVAIDMSAIVETNYTRGDSNVTTTTSEASSHIQTQSSVTRTELKSGYQKLHAFCDADDATLYQQESVDTNPSLTDPQLFSNRGSINQSSAREGSTTIIITEASSYGGSVHPQIPTPEITELQEQGSAARPPSNRSPSKQRPSLTFQTQLSIPELPLEQSQDAEQDQQGKSVENDEPQLQDQTSWPEMIGDSDGAEESGLPPPLPSIPRMLLERSQSLFTGSPPKTLLSNFERSSLGRRLSDQSQRRRSMSQRSKTNPEESKSLLEGSAKLQVGDDEEEHSDDQT